MGNMVQSFGQAFGDDISGVSESESGLGIPRITLRHLIYFSAAAENESALRAAEQLNVSPPAISGAISSLEQILGEQLFVRRHARGLTLTEAGHHLLLEARDIVGRVKEIESVRSSRARRFRNRIALGCLGDIAPNIVPPLVRSFRARFPQVEIVWQTDVHAGLMQKLEDGALDVIFVLDFEMSPNFHTTLLQAAPAQCVLPEAHPLAGSATIPLTSLAKEPFILLDIPKTRDYFLSVFGDLGVQPNIALKAPSAEMVRSLVANGFGYSLLNFCIPDRREIVYRPLAGHTRPSHLVAARPYRRRPSKISDDFIEQSIKIVRQFNLNGYAQ
ncbi:LysR family transcriptional regulator [Bradyrhizobium sp. dw_78]|uniref:LysR family transcriptional regulator n=1 Tax=Bradyrhizobium sp. dw_78 TaxID=2719793 RepID=UPI001BD53844|nr:LysR family transcriptional regulator [Bradyrhizobium sp. dw_78]